MNETIWKPTAAIPANTPGILFSIGSYNFHVYSLTLMLGFIASILTIVIFWMREKYKWEILLTLIFITVPTAIVGARLWDLVEMALYEPNYDFSRWYAIWDGGLSIQGGVFLAFCADLIYMYCKRDVIDIRKVGSLIIPTILIGQAIGRWGNYANHELYGRVDWSGSSVLIFGHKFASQMFISDSVSQAYNEIGLYRYPLFLYEGLANIVGYFVLVWIVNWFGLLKPGSSATLYFVWYGLVRFAMEPLRETSYNLYTLTSLVFVIVGALAFLFFEFFNPTHYVREWRKGRFVYEYAHPEKYIAWIESTRFIRTKRTKKPINELGQ